jgi:hypothetical protein
MSFGKGVDKIQVGSVQQIFKLSYENHRLMSRVFTVRFDFKGRSRTALVSFRESEDISLLIRYLDEDIAHVLPERKIVVSLTEGIKAPKQLSKLAEGLLNQTTAAISQYLYFPQ